MSLTLILMRHAKSAWDDPTLDDHERVLNKRGQRSAPAVADWLKSKDYVPDFALVSDAARTIETWERMAGHFPDAVNEATRALYLAGPDVILAQLQRQVESTVILICHNPGIAAAAGMFVNERPVHPDFARYPTAATAVIEFEAKQWKDVGWGNGQLLEFVVPRELSV